MLEKPAKSSTELENLYQDRDGLVYVRVSSKKQETDGSGLGSQEGRCIKDLQSIGVPYIKTFPDTFTGAGDFMRRPAMRSLLAYVDANPHKKFVVVFDDLKRFARDTKGHFELKQALRDRDVELRCLNHKFDDTEEGKFVETVLAAQAELERGQNRRQVIQKQKARLERGYWPFGHKKGYEMVKDPLHGKIARPTKEGRKVLKPALEAFARGEFKHKVDFCAFLVKRGFWASKAPEKFISQATAILSDYFYMGDIGFDRWEVSRRRGQHEGIISASTYEKIQTRLQKESLPSRIRKNVTSDFPLRGLITCVCGSHMTAAWSKGRPKKYGYYFCTNKECSFYKKSVPKKVVEEGFKNVLQKTTLKPEAGKLVELVFDRVWKEEVADLEKQGSVLIRQVQDLSNQIRDFTDMARKAKSERLRGAYERQIEEKSFELERVRADKTFNKIDPRVPYRTALRKARGLLKNPYPAWKKLEIQEQHGLFFFIFNQKLAYSQKGGYRTAEIPTAAGLFEDFVTSNSSLVEMGGIEPPCKDTDAGPSTSVV